MAGLGLVWAILFLGFALAQFYVGFEGIYFHLGPYFAWAAVIGCFVSRFMLPITIGVFFGAKDVFHWHWAWALIFAAPGLLFLVPGIIASILSALQGRRS